MQAEPEMNSSPGTLLFDRVALLGEGKVPDQLLEPLGQGELWIFLTEPNPDNFPPALQGLGDWLRENFLPQP